MRLLLQADGTPPGPSHTAPTDSTDSFRIIHHAAHAHAPSGGAGHPAPHGSPTGGAGLPTSHAGEGGQGHGLPDGHGGDHGGDHGLGGLSFDDFGPGFFDHLPSGTPIVVMPIDHLEINNNTLIENNLTENTNVVFNAADGGTVDVGGDVNALTFGSSQISLDQMHLADSSHSTGADLGWGEGAFGEAGGYDAVLYGQVPASDYHGAGPAPFVIMPIDHLEINNNTLVQNTQVENTNLFFNAGQGGTIDVDGNVNALSSQQALIDPSGSHHFLV
jgi:hypothetical protein